MFNYRIEIDREDDGRWIAAVPELPGVMVYGQTEPEAVSKVQALALQVLAAKIEDAGNSSVALTISFAAA
jgi:predicted RNase H-like HicB family nuclease